MEVMSKTVVSTFSALVHNYVYNAISTLLLCVCTVCAESFLKYCMYLQ